MTALALSDKSHQNHVRFKLPITATAPPARTTFLLFLAHNAVKSGFRQWLIDRIALHKDCPLCVQLVRTVKPDERLGICQRKAGYHDDCSSAMDPESSLMLCFLRCRSEECDQLVSLESPDKCQECSGAS
jgi:hypothetical protein